MNDQPTIMKEAERHSRRLGTIAIDAGAASWKHDELMREVCNASNAAKQDALARLAALNASYEAVPTATSPFRSALSSIGLPLTGGAVASLMLIGLAFATQPGMTAAAIPAPKAPIMSSADAEQFRALITQGIAAVLRALGDHAACADSAEPVHPVWHR